MKIRVIYFFLIFCSCLFPNKAVSQHFIGASAGYSMNNMTTTIYEDLRSVGSWNNYGLIYKYYGGEWGGKWVGIQTGLNYTEKGYQRDSSMIRRYQILELPFTTQLHYELWKIRIMGNAGIYGAYALSADEEMLYPPTSAGQKTSYEFQSTDRRFDYGLRFGGGLALMLHPVELQFDFTYSIGLGYTHKPVDLPNTTVYNRLTQMIFSLGILIAL